MSTWAERAHHTAEALDMEAVEATDPEDVQYGFREGAAWQREALLSDETVERAARALYEADASAEPWPTFHDGMNDMYRERARVALTAAMRDDRLTQVRADAHPQPRTITKNEFEMLCLTVADQIPPDARRAEVLAHTATYALYAAGIEVSDE